MKLLDDMDADTSSEVIDEVIQTKLKSNNYLKR